MALLPKCNEDQGWAFAVAEAKAAPLPQPVWGWPGAPPGWVPVPASAYSLLPPEQLGWKFQEALMIGFPALTSQACPHTTHTLTEPLSNPNPHAEAVASPS